MKQLALLLCLAVPLWGGAAIYFDGSSYYDCGDDYTMVETDAILGTVKQIGITAWVTPDFSSASGDRDIIGNWNTSGCGSGFILGWRAGVFIFAGRGSNCCASCPPAAKWTPVFSQVAAVFSAGDLLGIAGVLRHGTQHITVYNVTTDTSYDGLEFRGWDPVVQSTSNLEIGRGGADSEQNHWLGKIHLLILQTGEPKNSNVQQLPAISKFRYWPKYTGTTGAAGSGVGNEQLLDGVWLFGGEPGNGLETLRNEVPGNRNNPFYSCTAVGDPQPTDSEMMP